MKKLALAAAIVAQLSAATAFASDVRPAAIKVGSVSRLDVSQARVGTAVRRASGQVDESVLLPVLGGVALVAVVIAVASGGGDDDSSPN